eukprot:COSAG06_NODE_1314_length_9887_cov_10.607070_5_plen_117_part_00
MCLHVMVQSQSKTMTGPVPPWFGASAGPGAAPPPLAIGEREPREKAPEGTTEASRKPSCRRERGGRVEPTPSHPLLPRPAEAQRPALSARSAVCLRGGVHARERERETTAGTPAVL